MCDPLLSIWRYILSDYFVWVGVHGNPWTRSIAIIISNSQIDFYPCHHLFRFFYSSGVSLISTSSFNLMLVLNFRPPDIQNRHVTRHNRQEVGDVPRTSWQNSPQSIQFISLSMYYLFPVSAVSSSMSIGRQTGWWGKGPLRSPLRALVSARLNKLCWQDKERKLLKKQFLLGYETICRVRMTLIGLMDGKYLRKVPWRDIAQAQRDMGNWDSYWRQVVVILYPCHNFGIYNSNFLHFVAGENASSSSFWTNPLHSTGPPESHCSSKILACFFVYIKSALNFFQTIPL